MSWLEKIARALAPAMKSETEIRDLVAAEVAEKLPAEVRAAQAALPINYDYDPKGEGYRPVSASGSQVRTQTQYDQDQMLELAYREYDTSGIVKRFVRDTKNFVLGEGVTWLVECEGEMNLAAAAGQEKPAKPLTEAATKVVEAFWNHPMNQLDLLLENKIEFLNLLGEQCWPTVVNKYNGQVLLSYVDPLNIREVVQMPSFPEHAALVELKGNGGRSGKKLQVINPQMDPRLPHYGRLVGDCFFWKLNAPPNAPRGRSDLVHLFDFIDGFEEGIFDELDRLQYLKAFLWDVEVKGLTPGEVEEYARKLAAPKPGSCRVHNEQVTWDAVAPQLHHGDTAALFNLIRQYFAFATNRPESWYGAGGKAYSNEADSMQEPSFKDLGSRQRYIKYILVRLIQYVLDQAVIAGTLADRVYTVTVEMPEMSIKDLKSVVEGLVGLASSLMIAEGQQWLSKERAAEIFASVAAQVGVSIDYAQEIKLAADKGEIPEDYERREAFVTDLLARIERGNKSAES